jgi:hypothetical protein
LAAILAAAAITFHSCQAEPDQPPTEYCTEATKFSVTLCIDDSQQVYWTGLWDECFNLGTETSWTPESGTITIRSTWQLCNYGFRWKDVQALCPVPEYTWSVQPEYNYWVATLKFPPNECLAEAIPNCYNLVIYGTGCPY